MLYLSTVRKKERNLGVGITHVGVVAFGVGITEGLPIAEAELLRGGAERVHLVWAARTHEDMVREREREREELLAWKNQMESTWRVVTIGIDLV